MLTSHILTRTCALLQGRDERTWEPMVDRGIMACQETNLSFCQWSNLFQLETASSFGDLLRPRERKWSRGGSERLQLVNAGGALVPPGLTPQGYHLGPAGDHTWALQENWTWVKGAFHTVDRPYGRWLSLLGHPMTSHCKYVFKEIILSYIEIKTRDYIVRKFKFSRLESLLSRKHLPLGTRITRKTSAVLCVSGPVLDYVHHRHCCACR